MDEFKISNLVTENVETDEEVWFGQVKLSQDQIFATTNLSYALVNLKPIAPGHVLVASKNRNCKRISDMSQEELSDIWCLAKDVSTILEKEYNAPSFTFAIQDGIYAGQTINCVHIHIIPRTLNDITPNDKIYTKLEQDGILSQRTMISNQIEDLNRIARTKQEMTNESLRYRNTIKYFYKNNLIFGKNTNITTRMVTFPYNVKSTFAFATAFAVGIGVGIAFTN